MGLGMRHVGGASVLALLALSAGLAAVTAMVACSKETTPTAEEPRGVAPDQLANTAHAAASAEPVARPAADSPGASPTGAAPAASQLSEANFDLSLAPVGPFKAGEPGRVDVVLVAKQPFKCNDQYPYKFKPAEVAGVKFAAPVFKEGVSLEKHKAVLPVSFTPEGSGEKRIAGTFSFSVCTEERCLIEKRDLSLPIQVD